MFDDCESDSFSVKPVSKSASVQLPPQSELDNLDEFESIDAAQMSGLSKHVVYDIPTAITVLAKESSLVPIGNFNNITADLVLVYDPKTNELNAIRAVHLKK